MKFSREKILSREFNTISEHELSIVDHWVATILNASPYDMSFTVIAFYDVPAFVRNAFSFNGGDEDWLILSKSSCPDWLPSWLSHTDSCQDPDEYDMGSYYVWVGSHA